jgi:NAD(P)-dependent dehydrogenase (short-subunit alcohol dehydrogenase family)
MQRLQGRTALVTGASRGLGRAVALAYAREGASLALCARGDADLQLVAAGARARGVEVLAVPADVGSAADCERLLARALDRFGRVDLLVNSASTLGPTPLPWLVDSQAGDLEEVWRVNLRGPFLLTQGVLGGMLLRRSGLVLNVSSDAAVNGYPGWGAYSAAKAALDALTRVWAAELEGTGVAILSVDPGDMDTEMHRAALPDDDPSSLASPESVAEAFVELALRPPAAARVEARDFLGSGR